MHFKWNPVSVWCMFVWQHFGSLSLDGILQYNNDKKMQAFLFLQLIVLMHFVPVEFFILEIKGYNKNILEKMLWPWRGALISLSLASRTLAFDIYDFLDDLWLEFFHIFSSPVCFVLSFNFNFILFLFLNIEFRKKQRVSECLFLFFASLSIPEHYKFHLDFSVSCCLHDKTILRKRRVRSSLLLWINVLVWWRNLLIWF